MNNPKSKEQDRGPSAVKVELEKRLDRNEELAEAAKTGKPKNDPADDDNHAK